jgi:hypothetical protein
MLGSRFVSGPEESLANLKAMAEKARRERMRNSDVREVSAKSAAR